MQALYVKYRVPKETRRLIKKCINQTGNRLLFTLSQSEAVERLKSIRSDCVGLHRKTSLLHIACVGYDVEFVKFTLNIGIDINTLDEIHCNPLHFAVFYVDRSHAYSKRIEIIKYLLISGADYKQKNHNGFTPMDLLSGKQCKEQILDYIKEIELR